MDYACITITKRDGSKENFSIEKIERAIAKAYRADGMNDDETSIKQVTDAYIQNPKILNT